MGKFTQNTDGNYIIDNGVLTPCKGYQFHSFINWLNDLMAGHIRLGRGVYYTKQGVCFA